MPRMIRHHTFTQLGTIPAFKLFNSTEPDVLRLLFEHRPADSQVGVFTSVSAGLRGDGGRGGK